MAEVYKKVTVQKFIKQTDLKMDNAKNNKQQSPIGYLGEVERGNPWLKKLIERYGVQVLDIQYVQPPLRKGGKPIPLILYFQPHAKANVTLEKGFVQSLVHAIYQSIYAIKEPRKNEHFKIIMEDLK